MSNTRKVILLTGVPGVGKTTIASLLSERLRGVHVNLSELALAEGLVTGYDSMRETSIVDLERTTTRLMEIVQEGQDPLIIEGHFSQDIVPPEGVSNVFVLRRAPWRLKDELESRGYSPEKVKENVEAELLDVCLVEAVEAYGKEKVCELDTTGIEPNEIIETITSVLRGERSCEIGVDWLSHPESRELLGGGG
ncbi:adenylate kinase family protein [Candidatus Bathyarchaeota archaeon]|nr:adenylate kinase family protein [Candidatus Bathyarchaeota archaeon]